MFASLRELSLRVQARDTPRSDGQNGGDRKFWCPRLRRYPTIMDSIGASRVDWSPICCSVQASSSTSHSPISSVVLSISRGQCQQSWSPNVSSRWWCKAPPPLNLLGPKWLFGVSCWDHDCYSRLLVATDHACLPSRRYMVALVCFPCNSGCFRTPEWFLGPQIVLDLKWLFGILHWGHDCYLLHFGLWPCILSSCHLNASLALKASWA